MARRGGIEHKQRICRRVRLHRVPEPPPPIERKSKQQAGDRPGQPHRSVHGPEQDRRSQPRRPRELAQRHGVKARAHEAPR